jgi:DNA modification methylase
LTIILKTALACKELGRNYICIEKELEYYQIACQRINQPIEPEKEVIPVVEELPKNKQLSLFG